MTRGTDREALSDKELNAVSHGKDFALKDYILASSVLP